MKKMQIKWKNINTMNLGTWSEITDYNTLNILVKASFDKEHSTSTNSATLKIKETDKVGLSQVSEPICKGK